jgi:ABC-type uncharacterized transport system involved in gliding motility auxiliary subunit
VALMATRNRTKQANVTASDPDAVTGLARAQVRERIATLASALGATGLMLGIIGMIWGGGFNPLVTALLAMGVVGLAVWVAAAPREARALLTGRGARFSTVTAFSLAFLAGVITLVYLVIQAGVITLDMTTSNRFTLTRETLNVLDRVERPIQITGFYSPGEIGQRELDDQIFRLYTERTDGRIQRVYIDPQEQQTLAQSFGMEYDGQVFVSFLTEAGEVDYDSLLAVPRESAQERDLTTTLLRLLNTGEFSVGFEVGYSAFNPYDTSQAGFARIINGLVTNGIDFGLVDLREAVEQDLTLPQVDVIVLLRMNRDLPDEAVAILDAYLSRGGSLLILSDIQDEGFLGEDTLFNAYLWERYGIRALDAVVVDGVSRGASEVELLSYAVGGGNSITERMNLEGQDDTRALFRIARPIEINRTPPVPNGFVVASSPASYGERDIDSLLRANRYQNDAGVDIPGPLNVAAYAYNEENNSKILLIGDSDFITNGQVASPLGNSLLFTDGVAWLSGLNERIVFTPQARVTDIPLVFLSPQSLDQISFVTVVLMPAATLMLGAFIWWRRGRR